MFLEIVSKMQAKNSTVAMICKVDFAKNEQFTLQTSIFVIYCKGYVLSKRSNYMKCPNCGFSESKVIDSRPTDNGSIRRRRECLSCKKRFTTYEIIDAVPVFVVKKNGTKEMFDRNKIMAGLVKSCYKRPVTNEQLSVLISEIESELQNSLTSEIHTTDIGVMVMEKLRKLDEVSYVRFASVYREFKDVETFMHELKLLAAEKSE